MDARKSRRSESLRGGRRSASRSRQANSAALGTALGGLLLLALFAAARYMATTGKLKAGDLSPDVYAENRLYRYHRLNCSELRRPFDRFAEDEAEARGYQPCPLCDPP